jgi:hypothetical protein
MSVLKIVSIAVLVVSLEGLAGEALARGAGRGSSAVGSAKVSSAKPGTGSSPGSVHVRAYVRKDGTHVRAHHRSAADGNYANNWTTKGNTNLYTGARGTLATPPHWNIKPPPRLYGMR